MWKRPPVFVYLCKSVCWHVLSLWILISICLLMTIDVNRSRWSLSFFRHCFQNWTKNRYQRHQIFPLLLRTHQTEWFQCNLFVSNLLNRSVTNVATSDLFSYALFSDKMLPLLREARSTFKPWKLIMKR